MTCLVEEAWSKCGNVKHEMHRQYRFLKAEVFMRRIGVIDVKMSNSSTNEGQMQE